MTIETKIYEREEAIRHLREKISLLGEIPHPAEENLCDEIGKIWAEIDHYMALLDQDAANTDVANTGQAC